MKLKTIAEMKQQLDKITAEDDPLIREIRNDHRKGIQQLVQKWEKKREAEKRLQEKFLDMSIYERKWRSSGYKRIAGIDEVGRGPLAGPVVAACVILPADFYLPGIDDSKKLSEKKREEFATIINHEALAIGIGMMTPAVIDAINIYEATKKAMKAAIAALAVKPDFLLIDAMKLETPYGSESIIKGDAKSVSIAAASIIAKVKRDHLMKKLSESFPVYHFDKNMGYGTKEHIAAIQKYGITAFHRKSFAPIKDMLAER